MNKPKGNLFAGFLSAVFAVASLAASAKVVAWYHFDEAEPGTRTTADTVFTNTVDAAVGLATAHVWHRNNYNRPRIDETPEELMPDYTESFEEIVNVYDPLTGTVRKSGTALHLNDADNETSPGFKDGSSVNLAWEDAFNSQSFTIEFMLRFPEPCGQWHRTIFRKSKPFTSFTTTLPITFALTLTSDGTLTANLSTDAGDYSVGGGYAVTGGGWHHIAFVVDSEAKKFRLYVDKNIKEKDFEGSIDYTGNTPLTFGGSPALYFGTWNGYIDELRYSDTALAPEQFLWFTTRSVVSALTDTNTLFHASFSGSAEEQSTTNTYGGVTRKCIPAFVNDAAPRADYAIDTLVRKWYGSIVVPDSYATVPDVKYGRLVSEKTSTEAVDNMTSYRNISPEAKSYPPAMVIQDKYAVLKDSFTIEFFGKMATGVVSSGPAGNYGYLMGQNTALSFLSFGSGRLHLTTSAGTVLNAEDTKAPTYNDGQWHHYAFVYNKKDNVEDSTFDVYIDYKLAGHQDGAYFDYPTSNSSDLVFFGYYANYVYGPRDFTIDELRITRGALTADKFIQKEHLGLMLLLR